MKGQNEKLPDGRKYKLALICLIVLLAGFALASSNPIFVKLYPDLVTAVLGIMFIYSGGNVANKWSIGTKKSLSIASENNRLKEEGVENGIISR